MNLNWTQTDDERWECILPDGRRLEIFRAGHPLRLVVRHTNGNVIQSISHYNGLYRAMQHARRIAEGKSK